MSLFALWLLFCPSLPRLQGFFFFALATCFTAGSHINTALAPKLGTLYTATVNAKDTANKGASASNIKGGTQGNAAYFSDILMPFTKKCVEGRELLLPHARWHQKGTEHRPDLILLTNLLWVFLLFFSSAWMKTCT